MGSTGRRVWLAVRLVALGGVAALQFVSPAAPPASPEPPPVVVLPPPGAEAYPGIPWTLEGKEVAPAVISLATGPEHCDWQTLLFLHVGKRLGEPALTSDDAWQFIRDPANSLATVVPFGPSVAKPADAVFSGYRYGAMELWVSDRLGTDALLLKRDVIWEQWPRAREVIACRKLSLPLTSLTK